MLILYLNTVFLCCTGKAAVLEFTPNKSWPDIAYYNSWTAPNMGWRLHILDEVNTEMILADAAAASGSPEVKFSFMYSVILAQTLYLVIIVLA